jgi:hypothetical protein
MIGTIDYPLPPAANENANPFHKVGTGLMELHRLRRTMLAKDKTGYSPEQWHRYHAVLKGLDEAINLYLPYL